MSKTTQDYMNHFSSMTWNLQGPEFMQAMLMNLEVHNILRPDTMWHTLPKIKECIIVGAGPSLDQNVEELRDCGVPLIVTDRALPKVWKVNQDDIHCVTNLESTARVLWNIRDWWKGVPTEKLTLVAPSFCDPLLWKDVWKGPVKFINVLFAHGDLNRVAERIQFRTSAQSMTTGSNVGVMSYILAYNMGCKRIGWLGMDHVEYVKPPSPDDIYRTVKDVNGRNAYLWWNFFIGQWELLRLAESFHKDHGIETVNCTEGGILYSDSVTRMGLAEWLKSRTPIQEDEVRAAVFVVEGDKMYLQKEVQ